MKNTVLKLIIALLWIACQSGAIGQVSPNASAPVGSGPEAEKTVEQKDAVEFSAILSLVDRGRNEEAKKRLEQFIVKFPKSRIVPSALYQTVQLETNVDKARDLLRKILKEYPKTGWTPIAQFKIGEISFLAKDYNEAKDAYDKYIELYPHGKWFGNARLNAAYCLMRLDQHDKALEALEDLRKTTSGYEYDPKVLDSIGECRILLEQYTEAIDTLKLLIRKNPNYPSLPKVYLYVGLAYEELDMFDDAEVAYRIMIETFPSTTQTTIAEQRLKDLESLKNLIISVIGNQ